MTKKIYFLGIGGSGMSSAAGLCKQKGHLVSGSDDQVYPPASEVLAGLEIDYRSPFDAEHYRLFNPDITVIANVLSRGNPALESVLASGRDYTSFAALLEDEFLVATHPIVVAGTHGKTTTCSLAAHLLKACQADPSYFIGGLPKNFSRSFHQGSDPLFVVEGDEYDTAFFDKGPKFLHYRPKFLIVNNVEWDHLDIYPNVEAIEEQFIKLMNMVDHRRNIIANVDDPGVMRILQKLGWETDVTTVSTYGHHANAAFRVEPASISATPGGGWTFRLWDSQEHCLTLDTQLSGNHNVANIAQVTALMSRIEDCGFVTMDSEDLKRGIASFQGVRRRLDLIGTNHDIEIYEDFAHHPTAMRLVIAGFKKSHPARRVFVAFEAKSAIARRNTLEKDYCESLSLADGVYLGEAWLDDRIPEQDRVDVQALVSGIEKLGTPARSFATNDELRSHLAESLKSGDSVIFMSSGSFSGAQYRLAEDLVKRP